MSTPDHDATRAALSVMTALMSADHATEFAARTAEEYSADPAMGDERLVTGFINLSSLLLTMLEEEAGRDPLEALQFIATRPWNLSTD